MSNTIQEISKKLNCTSSIFSNDTIEYLLIDSRKISVPKSSLFLHYLDQEEMVMNL